MSLSNLIEYNKKIIKELTPHITTIINDYNLTQNYNIGSYNYSLKSFSDIKLEQMFPLEHFLVEHKVMKSLTELKVIELSKIKDSRVHYLTIIPFAKNLNRVAIFQNDFIMERWTIEDLNNKKFNIALDRFIKRIEKV